MNGSYPSAKQRQDQRVVTMIDKSLPDRRPPLGEIESRGYFYVPCTCGMCEAQGRTRGLPIPAHQPYVDTRHWMIAPPPGLVSYVVITALIWGVAGFAVGVMLS